MNDWQVAISPAVEHWAHHHGLIRNNQGHKWTIYPREYPNGDRYSDSLDVLWHEAIENSYVLLPQGVDVWVEFSSDVVMQVYVTMGEAVTAGAPITVISPRLPLAMGDSLHTGAPAVAVAVEAVGQVANELLTSLAETSVYLRARCSTSAEELRQCALTNQQQVLAAVAGNPHADEQTRTWAWLRTQSE